MGSGERINHAEQPHRMRPESARGIMCCSSTARRACVNLGKPDVFSDSRARAWSACWSISATNAVACNKNGKTRVAGSGHFSVGAPREGGDHRVGVERRIMM